MGYSSSIPRVRSLSQYEEIMTDLNPYLGSAHFVSFNLQE